MEFDLDQTFERRHSDSRKWNDCGENVIPLTGAEMEFAPPRPVLRALRQRVEHQMFGYNVEPPELRGIIVDRLKRAYGWEVAPEALVFLPGVVVGFNLACHAFARRGEAAMVLTPVYGPMLQAPLNAGIRRQDVQLVCEPDGRCAIDFGALESAVRSYTRILLLCNPHNPVGRVYRKDELERLAKICLWHDITICSDEIYGDWVFSGNRHVPIASIDHEVAQRTVTLIGTSKSHNLAGVKCGVAVVENGALREKLAAVQAGLVPAINVLEYTAALAAYQDGQPWQDAVLRYLEESRDLLSDYVSARLPGVSMHRPEGTPVAWLDCRRSCIPGNPTEFFLRRAQVALNDGASYGAGGDGFVRLAFGCPRSLLIEGLERMRDALAALPSVAAEASAERW